MIGEKQYFNERWKPVIIEGLKEGEKYEISDYGRIRYYKKDLQDWKIYKNTNVNGYPYFSMFKSNRGWRHHITKCVHRLVADNFCNKPSEEHKFVTHLNFDKTDPYYDPKAFGLWLYPLANQENIDAGGQVRIEFSRAATEFATSDTDKVQPIDRPFHDLIAIGAALKWSLMKGADSTNNLAALYQAGRDKMIKHYSKRNEDRIMTFKANLIENYH